MGQDLIVSRLTFNGMIGSQMLLDVGANAIKQK